MQTILIIFFILCSAVYSQSTAVKTIDNVDLKKYSGKWYEISKIPNSFQDHCIKNTTANYEINEEGDIYVTNSCFDSDDELDDATGLARVVDKNSNSKLEVSFVSILGWHIFWGDYWILGLDDNYQYAVVGTPSRKYGWILCREPEMDKNDLENCYRILESNGYDRTDFTLSRQEWEDF